MRVNAEDNDDSGSAVHLGEVENGFLYRYEMETPKGVEVSYLLATTFDTRRYFVNIEDGSLYNGDRGKLFLLEQVEFYVGKRNT